MKASTYRYGVVGVGALLMLSVSPSGAAVQPGVRGGEVGTVQTVAGPGFCESPSVVDPESVTVRALAVDAAGRIYVDTGPPSDGAVGRIDGGVTRMVSTGVAVGGDALVDGPAGEEQAVGVRVAASPASRLAPDRDGGVLVAAGTTLLGIAANDETTVVAGAPSAPPVAGPDRGGDGGLAGGARFRHIAAVATDEAGNAYVADEIDRERATVRIRVVNRSADPLTFYPGMPQQLTIAPGHIDTVAGADGAGNAADGGPASVATLAGVPPALAVAGGRLYLGTYRPAAGADGGEARIRMVNLGGEPVLAHGMTVAAAAIDTVAGGGAPGFHGDRGPARSAAFSYVPGIAADGVNLYLADSLHHRVRRIDAEGTITTVAGIGDIGLSDGGFNGNGRPADEARLNRPYDVDVGPDGRLYISDRLNGQVRFLDATGVIHAAPGAGLGRRSQCGEVASGERPLPQPGKPSAVAAGVGDDVYFLTYTPPRLKRLTASGTVVTVNTSGVEPVAMALRPQGGIYLLDSDGATLHFLNLGLQPATVHGITVAPAATAKVAENPAAGGGSVPTVAVGDPSGIRPSVAADAGGNVFVTGLGGIRQVSADGNITTIGESAEFLSGRCCRLPTAVAPDVAGNLYVIDSTFPPSVWLLNRGSQPVRAHGQDVAPGAIGLVAGSVLRANDPSLSEDLGNLALVDDEGRPAIGASFVDPEAITTDGQGNVYISDIGGGAQSVVRRVDADGTITTVAGSGASGFNGDALKGPLTALNVPSGLAVDRCGDLIIADRENDRVRRVILVATCRTAARAPVPTSPGRPFPRAFLLAGAGALALVAAAGVTLLRGRRVTR